MKCSIITVAVLMILMSSVVAETNVPTLEVTQGTLPQELILEQLLEQALAHDERVRGAHARLSAYRAKYKQAKWAYFPMIQVEAGLGGPVGSRKLDKEKCAELNIPEEQCIILKKNWHAGSFDFGEVSVVVGTRIKGYMPLYTFGKISGAKKATLAGVSAGKSGIRHIRQQVAMEIREAWYAWQLACSAVQILQDGQEKAQDAEQKLIKMLDEFNEDVTQKDLFKFRYHTSEIRTLLVFALKSKSAAFAAIHFLTGIEDLGGKLTLAEEKLQVPKLAPLDTRIYFEKAKKLRSELKILEAVCNAARAQVKIQKGFLYPDLALTGNFNASYSPVQEYIENPLLNNGYTDYGGELMMGFILTLDIPQKLAKLEQARADLLQAETQMNYARKAVELEIDKRLLEIKSAQDTLKVAKRGHRAAKAWMRSNFLSYGVGLTDTKDLVDSLVAYAKSKISRDKTIYDMLLARDRLQAAVGQDLSKVQKRY